MNTAAKIFMLLAIAISTLTIQAQTDPNNLPIDEATNMAKWEGVKEVKDASKDELYDRAIAWINAYYPNPAGIIKKQDKAAGEIEGKARFKLNNKDKKGIVTPSGGIVEYTFNLYFKDGRYKYEITRIHYVAQSYYDVSKWLDKKQANYQEEAFNYYLQQTIDYMDKLEGDMQDALKKSLEKKKSDW